MQHDNRSLGDKIRDFFTGDDDRHYRTHHESTFGASGAHQYDDARPAYEYGHTSALDERFHGRSFDDAEVDLRRDWESRNAGSNWDDVRPYARDAYARGAEQRLVLSEEQLAVGKRQVQAGEVSLRKTVESDRVQETVGLTREEVTIERHPITADSARGTLDNATIGEETIRVPLMAEEAVVDKRVVPVEEVVVRKEAHTDQQTVEDTVRRERLVTDGLDAQGVRSTSNLSGSSSSAGLSGAQDRATDSGLLDRAADKLDDVKDRVDGNPASRPGPDATDRRI